ncbi:acyl-CoA thioesterase [Paroceanicella profunda]|uniref:Acyl-CoA thioesterase n=1 Tax=Paroceanicella profunda TaxID=2579971 RepID=A0A5B8FSY6_9RHOB|nr:acyl-CoA thioesterase [Paroceanicella profunda]QDL90434.1 acyl-CoA thioesterase [Paroceanicella profunda]
MFPFIRLALSMRAAAKLDDLPVDGTHVSQHSCLPWDLDMFAELNNGRFLTLFDLGRLPLAKRTGLLAAVKRENWRLTMAGVTVRYRRRVQVWSRFEMRSRMIGRDPRFLYMQQSMWRDGDCLASALYRAAVADTGGIVPTDRVLAALGAPDWAPEMPGWVMTWARSEAERPWPPET